MTEGATENESSSTQILDTDNADDRCVLAALRADKRIDFIDEYAAQAASLRRLLPPADPELLAEPRRWAYYPWRRAVVCILGPRAFRVVRLDRNRNLITAEKQDRLATLKVGVVGLSVGHAIAYTLAASRVCGELRLADFDTLDLSNLNRVPATVLDLGVNKATVAARRIAELDPYLPVEVVSSGLTWDTIGEFLEGLDVVVEECDSLDMKALVREAARARRIPVLMATSDRGLVDVERYDLDPSRPILHGLLGDIDIAQLSGLSSRDKVPYVLQILDAAGLSAQGAASLVEIGHTRATWPQLAHDVVVGAAAVAEAVRRIGLGEALGSGRVRIDIAKALDRLEEPTLPIEHHRPVDECVPPIEPADSDDPRVIVAAAAARAPSGGNAQPWHIHLSPDSIAIRLAPEHTSTMDVNLRGSAVAVGAAVFNARVAAAAHGILGPVEVDEGEGPSPLSALVRFADNGDRDLARLYRPMFFRETNRNPGVPRTIDGETVRSLEQVAACEGARLRLLTAPDDIERAAKVLGAADRVRYLTPDLHAEMMSELRWPGDGCPDSGIDVRSLELDQVELAQFDIIRRPDVMAQLAEWDAGAALEKSTYDRVCASSGLGIVSVYGHRLTDYARGGSAVEAVWITAQQSGLAIQPVSPVFLYAGDDDDLRKLSPGFASSLRRMQQAFRKLAESRADEFHVLVLKFSHGPRTSVRSRRRSLDLTAAQLG